MLNDMDNTHETVEEEAFDFPPELGIMADSVITGEVAEELLIEEETLPPPVKRRLRNPHSISLADEAASFVTVPPMIAAPSKAKKAAPPVNARAGRSLNTMTKRFMELLHANGGTCDLNTAARLLGENEKRRIYDITNVLEGAGLVERSSKCVITSKLSTSFSTLSGEELDDKIETMKIEINSLESKEAAIDKQMRHLKQNIEEFLSSSENIQYMFTDLYDPPTLSPKSKQVIIQAQPGMTFEVPPSEYDFNRNIESYGLLVNGSIGPLECCFLGKRVVKKANECTTDLQGTSPIQSKTDVTENSHADNDIIIEEDLNREFDWEYYKVPIEQSIDISKRQCNYIGYDDLRFSDLYTEDDLFAP